jgi:3-methyladenine DNA glycosylase AlkD
MEDILTKVRNELRQNSDEKRRQGAKHFFKEWGHFECYGVEAATTAKISRENFGLVKHLPKAKIFELCESLWQSAYLEESFIACNWSYAVHKSYKPEDFEVFERWIKSYVNNWASCDTLCNHTVGEFLEMYPGYISKLKEFAKSGNRWVRRAASVSLIVPARKGKFLPEIFELADILLLDKDDLVQKGYGWMLKVASQVRQKEVFDFVMERRATMPRTALRYAIEKMPAELKKHAMAKV